MLYDPEIPLVCMDEQPYELLGQKYEVLPVKQGMVVCEDYQYMREGFCWIFMFCEPLGGRRLVDVSRHLTRLIGLIGFGSCFWFIICLLRRCVWLWIISIRMRWVFCMRLFCRWLFWGWLSGWSCILRLSMVGWLNIAEIELSAMAFQCLDRRISSMGVLVDQISAWKLV